MPSSPLRAVGVDGPCLRLSCNSTALPAMPGCRAPVRRVPRGPTPSTDRPLRRPRLPGMGGRCPECASGYCSAASLLLMVFSVFYKDFYKEQVGLAGQAFSFARGKFQKSQGLIPPVKDLREEVVSLICENEQSLGGVLSLESGPSVWNPGPQSALLCMLLTK